MKLFKRSINYSEWLVPYLEGGLDEAQAAQMKARLAADPALAAEAERLRRTLGHLRRSAAEAPAPANASVPADLWPRLRQRLEPAPAPRRAARPLGWIAGVGAAAALAFAALWLPIWHGPDQKQPARVHPGSSQPVQVAEAPQKEGPRKEAPNPNSGGQEKSRGATVPRSGSPELGRGGVSGSPASGAGGHLPPSVLTARDPFAGTGQTPERLKHVTQANVPAAPSDAKLTLRQVRAADVSPGPRMASSALPLHDSDSVAGTSPLLTPMPTTMTPPAPVPAPPAPAAPLPTATQAAPAQAMANAAGGAMPGATAMKPAQGNFSTGPIPFNSPPAQANIRSSHKYHPAIQMAPGARVSEPLNDADGAQTLDTWQSSLAQALQPPLLGDDSGAQQANQALLSVRLGGALDTLRGRLEQKRAQSPRDIVTARMLAATYEFGGQSEAALREHRRLVGLDGATGEDWYALALAEGSANNSQAARAAYQRALSAPAPLSGQHAALAKQRS